MAKKDKVIERKKKQVKKFVEIAAMGLGLLVMFCSITYREEVATTLNVGLGPFASFIDNILIVILLLAVVTGIYTSIVQKYTTNWELMAKSKEYQKQIREIQKEFMEAKKEDNQHKMKKIEKRRAEVMRKQTQFSGEMMKQQFKPMAYIMIITIPIFMWIWHYVGVYSPGPVIFPLIGVTYLSAFFIISFPYWVLWYMVCSIPIAQVIRKAIGVKSAM